MSIPSGPPDNRTMLSPLPQYRPPWWRKLFPARPAKDTHIKPRSPMRRAATVLIASAASVVIVLACMGTLYGIAVKDQGDQPLSVVRAFCAAEMAQDYTAAYALFSDDAFTQRPDQFSDWSQRRDQQFGTVQQCAVTGRDYFRELDPNGAAFNMRVAFASGAVATGVLALHRYRAGGGQIIIAEGKIYWAIFAVEAQLHLAAT